MHIIIAISRYDKSVPFVQPTIDFNSTMLSTTSARVQLIFVLCLCINSSVSGMSKTIYYLHVSDLAALTIL